MAACVQWAGGQTLVTVIPVEDPVVALAIHPTRPRLYAMGERRNEVTVIDTEQNRAVSVISGASGFPINTGGDLLFSPDGSRLYVAARALERLLVIDPATDSLVASAATAANVSGLAFTLDGRKLYVGHAGLTGSISVIDPRTLANTRNIPLTPIGRLTLHPNGSRLYVAAQGGIAVVDTSSDALVTSLQTSGWRVAVSPDGSRFYVHSQFFERIEVLSTTNNTVIASIPVRTAAGPRNAIAITPNGAKLYVTSPFQLAVIDARANTLQTLVTLPHNPVNLAVSTDGSTVFVAAEGSVQLVDVASNNIKGSVPLGGGEMVLHPNGSRLYVATGGGVAVIDTRPAVTSVSAASFLRNALAPESIASAFGQGLATASQGAASLPLPTTLAGATVRVLDSARVERPAPLFYASPGQINFLVPPGVRSGPATVTVTIRDQVVAFGTLVIDSVAPGLFTANADGRGVVAGFGLRVAADRSQTVQPLYQCGSAPGSCVPVPLDLGAEGDQTVLLLFGTGIRGRGALSGAQVGLGGVPAEVLYAGPQGDFAGLDQVNVLVPRTMAGRGELEVRLTVDGRPANLASIRIR